MGLLEKLTLKSTWDEFLTYKTEKQQLSKDEEIFFKAFISEKAFLPLCSSIAEGNYTFSSPQKKLISKTDTAKKRTVYIFSDEEMAVLKVIAYLLYEYDGLFCDNLYSFRKDRSAKMAFSQILKTKALSEKYAFKTDIHDYFNSIDTPILLNILKTVFSKDPELYFFFEKLLLSDNSLFEGSIINEKHGAMAGTPTSVFLANVYLMEMDKFFYSSGISYFRYSDDIIVFADTEEEISGIKQTVFGFLNRYKLTVNREKDKLYTPESGFSFLGFSYKNGTVDISAATKMKLKAKIRRLARSFRRWQGKKKLPPQKALRGFNKKLNRKLYSFSDNDILCWSRYFFPLLNTDVSLKEIDGYIQQWERYIITGRHSKKNIAIVPYDYLKENGYVSLVNSYYSKDR